MCGARLGGSRARGARRTGPQWSNLPGRSVGVPVLSAPPTPALPRTPLLQRCHVDQALCGVLGAGARAVSPVPVRLDHLAAGAHGVGHRGRDGVQRVGARPRGGFEVPQPASPRPILGRAIEPAARPHRDRCHHLGAHQSAAGQSSRLRPGRAVGSSPGRTLAQAVSPDAVSQPRRCPDGAEPGVAAARSRIRCSAAASSAASSGGRRCRDHGGHAARGACRAVGGRCAVGGAGVRCRHA